MFKPTRRRSRALSVALALLLAFGGVAPATVAQVPFEALVVVDGVQYTETDVVVPEPLWNSADITLTVPPEFSQDTTIAWEYQTSTEFGSGSAQGEPATITVTTADVGTGLFELYFEATTGSLIDSGTVTFDLFQDTVGPETAARIDSAVYRDVSASITATDVAAGAGETASDVAAVWWGVGDSGSPTPNLHEETVTVDPPLASVTELVDIDVLPGDYVLFFRAADAEGNVSGTQTLQFTAEPAADTLPPLVEAQMESTTFPDVSASIAATDVAAAGETTSGVAAVWWGIGDFGGTAPNLHEETVTVDPPAPSATEIADIDVLPGAYTLYYRAADAEGNVSDTQTLDFTVEPLADSVPPEVSAEILSAVYPDVTASISATDVADIGETTSGVAAVWWGIGDSGSPTPNLHEETVTVDPPLASVTELVDIDVLPGDYVLFFRAADAEGNVSEVQTLPFTVEPPAEPLPDVTPPEVSAAVAEDIPYPFFLASISATDPAAPESVRSGVAAIWWGIGTAGSPTPNLREATVTVDPAAASTEIEVFELLSAPPGDYVLFFRSADASGNVSVAETLPFTLPGVEFLGFARLEGADRYQTALDVSRANWEDGSADEVVVATGEAFPDALSASGLAGYFQCPVLLTRRDSVPSGVVAEMRRLGVDDVYVIGSGEAVSTAVARALSNAGFDIVRLQGPDRYATAAAVARRLDALRSADGEPVEEAFVVRGDDFADAVAVSPFAYAQAIPVLLVNPANAALPSPTQAALRDIGIDDVVVAGGTAAVPGTIFNALRAFDATPARWAGANRYATAVAVARNGVARVDWVNTNSFVGLATGLNYPDALTGGAALGYNRGVLLLTLPDRLPGETASYISARTDEIAIVLVFGSESAVRDGVIAAVDRLFP